MENFEENKPYRVNYRGKHLTLFSEAVSKYLKYLEQFISEDNKSLQEIIAELAWLISSINSQKRDGAPEWGFAELHLNGKYWRIIKAVLPALKQQFEEERSEILGRGAPKEAVEGLDIKISTINEVLSQGFLSQVPPAEITLPVVGEEAESDLKPNSKKYIEEELIKDLSNTKNNNFNTTKLTTLLYELNTNYENGNAYSVASLIRAIVDHVPPIFEKKSFSEVVSNHKWSVTDKKYMQHLEQFRTVGDDALHRMISKKKDLLGMGDIPQSIVLRTLLCECATILETEDHDRP